MHRATWIRLATKSCALLGGGWGPGRQLFAEDKTRPGRRLLLRGAPHPALAVGEDVARQGEIGPALDKPRLIADELFLDRSRPGQVRDGLFVLRHGGQ